MSIFFETLDEIENRFLSNSHNFPILVDTLIGIDSLLENTNDDVNIGLSNSLKSSVRIKT